MSLKVLNEHLVHSIGSWRVTARVAHRASAAVEVLPHDHGHLPEAGVGSRGARRDHAVVEELVVEGVGPAGRSVLVDRHRRVVREVRLPQHFEHVVAADLQRAAPRFFPPSRSREPPPSWLVSAFDGWRAGDRFPEKRDRRFITRERIFFSGTRGGNVLFVRPRLQPRYGWLLSG